MEIKEKNIPTFLDGYEQCQKEQDEKVKKLKKKFHWENAKDGGFSPGVIKIIIDEVFAEQDKEVNK